MAAEGTPSLLYVPDLGGPGSSLALSPDESHYLHHVCRARPGDAVRATDGRGTLAELRIVAVGKLARAQVERLDRQERRRHAQVLCGAPEGQRADWLVEKLAELGIEVWQPLACERGKWPGGAGRHERWERLTIAAMRQSRSRFRMEVREPVEPRAALAALPGGESRWLASPEGEPIPPAEASGASVAAIGPASGFTPAERELLMAGGFRPIRLAEARLRTETAALAWAVWWGLG